MRFKNMVLSTVVALLMFCISLPTAQAKPYIENMTKYVEATSASQLVDTAQDYLGVSYCRGGTSPSCFDCSGFTQYVYNKRGIDIPRIANDQYQSSTKILIDGVVPGNLVFFINNGYAYHVGIYVGDRKVLHSPYPGSQIKIETIWTDNVRFGKF